MSSCQTRRLGSELWSWAEVLSSLGKVGSASGGQPTGSAPHKPTPAVASPLPETGVMPAHSRLPVGQGRAALAPRCAGAGSTQPKGWLWGTVLGWRGPFLPVWQKGCSPKQTRQTARNVFSDSHWDGFFSLC